MTGNRASTSALKALLTVFIIGMGGALAAPALSQSVSTTKPPVQNETGATSSEEIIVTAQRRKERLLDVPIAVTAFGTEQLERSGINSTADLAIVTPGLEFGTQAAYGQPFLRGVGTTGTGPGVESPIALYVDGIYYGAMIGSVLTLNNIEQIEILKGPQGTLFGRNATGGLIQITTRDPSHEFKGSLAAGYGSYQTASGDLYVTGGLTDTLAGDLAIHLQDQGKGFGRNLFTGTEVNKTQDLSIRSKWLWTSSDDTSARLSLDYEHQTFRQAYVPAPGTIPPGDVPYTGDPQGLNGIFDPDGRLDQGGIGLQIKHAFSGAELVSLSGYRQSRVFETFDGGLTRDPNSVLNLDINEKHRQYTQEVQLNSTGKGWLKWSTGVFLLHADGRSDPLVITTLGLFGPPPTGLNYINVFSRQKTDSAAVYGQATAAILPDTNVTIGLRYTAERRKFEIHQVLIDFAGAATTTPTEKARKAFHKVTWRLAIDHHVSPDMLIYASYNRGYKSGGFNDYLSPQIYRPEVLDAYEVGAKADLLDRRLHVETSFFYYEYKNIQAVEYPQGVEIIRNAAQAHLYGIDVDLTAVPVEGMTLTAGFEYLHDRFTSFPDATIAIPIIPGGGTAFARGDVKGNRLGFTPDYTLSAGLTYRLPATLVPPNWGEVSGAVNWSHNDGFFAEPENRLRQPAYDVVNAQIAWALPDSLTTLTLWGGNLTQAVYTVALASQDSGDFAIFAPPRTYGIRIERRF